MLGVERRNRKETALKTLRATLAALLLLALMAFPALAQEFSGTITVDCFSDPETVTVENTGSTPFVVDSITSLNDPRENEPFDVSVEVEAGESVTFESGETADANVLVNQFIFDNEADDEGVEVVVNTEGEGATTSVDCNDGSGTFAGTPGTGPTPTPTDGKPMPGKMPNNGGGGMATGSAGLPIGNALAGLTLLVGAGYAVVRRR